jgi:hypothetical protein
MQLAMPFSFPPGKGKNALGTAKMVAVLWLVALGGILSPTNLWSQTVVLEPLLSGLDSPLYVTNAHDGSNRLFIVERGGRVLVLQPGVTEPFLDISARVLAGGERGLLGLAFHPQFASTRRFFVNYTRMPDGATVIAEYRVSASNGNVAETEEIALLTVAQPFANHNGGMIEFGPDGFLYIGLGDGGSANDPDNRAQNTQDLLGKILRIDVDRPQSSTVLYSSPATNPFVGADPGRDEIFALGLRNPWRFSFDRGTGSLYVGDVGQGEREEIDIVTVGGNYGWHVFEGTRCTGLDPASCATGSFLSPIAEYAHTNGQCSITGGYVYRGNMSTLPLGTYVYGDYCTGEIFLLQPSGEQQLLLDTDLAIASFGEDEAGELYVVGLGGTVHRLANANASPTTITAECESPENGQVVAGVATIRGWAFATQAGVEIRSVELFIDGTFSGNIPCCAQRADVQAAFPQFLAENTLESGWGMAFNWGVLSAGPHAVRVEITNTAGERFMSDTRTVIVVRPGDFEFLDQFDLSGARTRVEGEELVMEGVVVQDKATREHKEITVRFRWLQSSQTLSIVESQ